MKRRLASRGSKTWPEKVAAPDRRKAVTRSSGSPEPSLTRLSTRTGIIVRPPSHRPSPRWFRAALRRGWRGRSDRRRDCLPPSPPPPAADRMPEAARRSGWPNRGSAKPAKRRVTSRRRQSCDSSSASTAPVTDRLGESSAASSSVRPRTTMRRSGACPTAWRATASMTRNSSTEFRRGTSPSAPCAAFPRGGDSGRGIVVADDLRPCDTVLHHPTRKRVCLRRGRNDGCCPVDECGHPAERRHPRVGSCWQRRRRRFVRQAEQTPPRRRRGPSMAGRCRREDR